MRFIEKDDSPGFPYPTAFPGLGAAAAYPISGEYSTNPNYYYYEVIKSRRARRHPARGTHFDPGFPDPLEGFAVHQQNICWWIAKYWKEILSSTDHANWYTFQQLAQASANPPISWTGSWYTSHGWAMFFLLNKTSALIYQPFSAAVLYSRQVSQPLAPAAWAPYRITSFTVTPKLSSPFTQVGIYHTPVTGRWVTLYSSLPGRQAGPFGGRPLLQLWTQYFLPGQTEFAWPKWNQAFPHARPGQYVTFGARVSRADNYVPSNLATYTTTVAE
jgi:hypothetical protein